MNTFAKSMVVGAAALVLVLGATACILWRLAAKKGAETADEASGSPKPATGLNAVKSGLVDLARKTSLPFVQEGDDFVPTLHIVGGKGTTLFNIAHNGLEELWDLAECALKEKGEDVSAYLLAYSVSGRHDGKLHRLLIMDIAERGDARGVRLGIPVDAETGNVVGDVLDMGDAQNFLSP